MYFRFALFVVVFQSKSNFKSSSLLKKIEGVVWERDGCVLGKD